jgi:hypothetical protein
MNLPIGPETAFGALLDGTQKLYWSRWRPPSRTYAIRLSPTLRRWSRPQPLIAILPRAGAAAHSSSQGAVHYTWFGKQTT